MSLEIAIIYAVVTWFFIELWKSFSSEGFGKYMRVLYMMIAFIHAIAGTFVLEIMTRTETITQTHLIFRALLFLDTSLIMITMVLLMVGWTDKLRKSLLRIVDKFRE